MGALELEGPGRRPQGRGCFLLAVAGATSLVTLLLAVPITILAVLALVHQEQGGLVPEAADPGAQAQQGLGFQQLPGQGDGEEVEDEVDEQPEADLSTRLPAAHIIGSWMKGQGLGWEANKEEAFLRSGTQFSGAAGLALPQDGLYYLYCHVGYRGRAPPAGGDPRGRSVVVLRSSLYRAGGAYGPGAPQLLLEGAETVTAVVDWDGRREYGPLWYTSVGFGGLVQLRRGERVYVNISHPDMVDYRRGKTSFGAVMVG